MSYVTNPTDEAFDAASQLTTKAIEVEVRKLAKRFPGMDAECNYVGADGTPQCIIGRACNVLGITIPQLLQWEGCPVNDLPFQGNDSWLQSVQSRQDEGSPWGIAVSDADRSLNLE